MINHPIPPFFDGDSKILILGSCPSVKSREAKFFYGHPQNRFWKVLSEIYGEAVPETVEEKKALLRSHKIALWDVIASCDITASADSSIRNAMPNDLSVILSGANIERIFVNGKTAEKYYKKYQEARTAKTAAVLPSTSPANAAIGFSELVEAWRSALVGEDKQI